MLVGSLLKSVHYLFELIDVHRGGDRLKLLVCRRSLGGCLDVPIQALEKFFIIRVCVILDNVLVVLHCLGCGTVSDQGRWAAVCASLTWIADVSFTPHELRANVIALNNAHVGNEHRLLQIRSVRRFVGPSGSCAPLEPQAQESETRWPC